MGPGRLLCPPARAEKALPWGEAWVWKGEGTQRSGCSFSSLAPCDIQPSPTQQHPLCARLCPQSRNNSLPLASTLHHLRFLPSLPGCCFSVSCSGFSSAACSLDVSDGQGLVLDPLLELPLLSGHSIRSTLGSASSRDTSQISILALLYFLTHYPIAHLMPCR